MGLDVELRVNSPALLILGVLKTHVNFLQRTNRREKKKRGGGGGYQKQGNQTEGIGRRDGHVEDIFISYSQR